MPSKAGCSPVDIDRSGTVPRSAWRTSVVDKTADDYATSADFQGHYKVIQDQAVRGRVILSFTNDHEHEVFS